MEKNQAQSKKLLKAKRSKEEELPQPNNEITQKEEKHVKYQHLVIQPELKFLFLYTYLKKFSDKKIAVVFSTKEEVAFFTLVLKAFNVSMDNFIFGDFELKLKSQFYMIIFYDNPSKELIKDKLNANNILILLYENEKPLLSYYEINSSAVSFSKSMLSNIQKKFEEKVSKEFELYDASNLAYKAYIRSYATSELNKENKRNADGLDVKNICFQFGSSVPLFVTVK